MFGYLKSASPVKSRLMCLNHMQRAEEDNVSSETADQIIPED